MRILIVEDEVRLAQNIAAALREGLIEQMLALARIEEEAEEVNMEVDLGLVVRSVVTRLQPMADRKQITIRLDVGESWPIRMSPGDADILGSNLIMNAVQHTPLEARIMVSVDCDGRGMELRVVDEGPGIPEAALPHLFERFYRADESRSRNDGGTGLGLAICKAIVERSRGTIAIESSPGMGTLVRVMFHISGKCAGPSGSVKD